MSNGEKSSDRRYVGHLHHGHKIRRMIDGIIDFDGT